MIRRLMTAGMVAALLCAPTLAQAQANTADLTGTVQDQTGAILPGVEITVTNADTGLVRTTISNDEGNYRVPLLPPGTYDVRAVLAGFSPKVIQGVTLTVGQYGNLDIELNVSGSQEEVVVLGDAALIEKEKTVQASTVQEKEIDNLPINGRNFLDFALLTPGVSDKSTFVTDKAIQTPTSGLSFGGQDQRSNYVTIDGVDNMDVISNSVRSTLSQEAIQEFQISRNTFSAEFGRARAGVINIVSKSGTNDLHGNVFWFTRNQALDARNTFAFGPNRSSIDPPFERHQFGGTFGGPLVKDQTFFFASYERLARNESIFVTFNEDPSIFAATASQRELFEFLDSTGVPSLHNLAVAFLDPGVGALNTTFDNFAPTRRRFDDESGVFPFHADRDTVSFKIDHELNDDNQLHFRLNFTDEFSDGVDFGALDAVSNGVSFDTRDFSMVIADTHIFSPTKLNDFKFQFAKREFAVPTNDPDGPQISLSGVAEFGREFFNPTGYDQDVWQIVDNLTLIKGKHTLKLGGDVNFMDMSGFAEVFLGGEFTFGEAIPLGLILDNTLGPGTATGLGTQLATSLGRPDLVANLSAPITPVQSFNFGLPITYFQGFGDPNTNFLYSQLGLYIQDNWHVSDRFTLNLGLRWDVDWKPETQNVINNGPPWQFEKASLNDRDNFAPRIGFAWSPSNRMVLRGGYGLYYSNFFQAVAFVSQVLSGQISQVFLPITGIPGIQATSADVWERFLETGPITTQDLAELGVNVGTTPSVILPAAGDVVNPYSHQASLGYERQLGRDMSFSLDYIFNKGLNLIRSHDINLRQVGPNQYATPGRDPRFIQVNMLETSGRSQYHGFTASFSKRYRSTNNIRVSYTYGKSIDDTTDFITQLQANDQNNFDGERALSSFDQRHRLVVSFLFTSPWQTSSGNNFGKNILADWTLSTINTASSGKPFNVLTGFDLNGDTHEETDRPVLTNGDVVGRNTGKGPNFFTTDLRLSRKFEFGREDTNFEFIFEAFNLFNNVNYSGVNNVVGALALQSSSVEGSKNISANQPLGFTSAFDPRQIQFGFRFNF